MAVKTLISEAEYLRNEKDASYKNEYRNGEVFPIRGESIKHNIITANLIGILGFYYKKQADYRVYPSQFLICIPDYQLYTYSDVIIVEGITQLQKNSQGLDVLENPTVIIEVLSDSTEAYDRGKKFNCYKTLASLKQYVLVATDEKLVETYERTDNDKWLLTTETKPENIIKIGDCEIPLTEIYDKMIWD